MKQQIRSSQVMALIYECILQGAPKNVNKFGKEYFGFEIN